MDDHKTKTIVMELAEAMKRLKLDFQTEDISAWAVSMNADEKTLEDSLSLLDAIFRKGYASRRTILSDTSGLPKEDRNTFDNFDFSCTTQQNRDAIMAIKTLSFLTNGYNVIITGDTGTGKTHIAQAIGNECLDHLIKTSFMTLTSLKARMDRAIRNGKVDALVASVSSIQCVIIDEVDKCTLDRDETAILFDIVNRKYSTKGSGSIILTSNSQPSSWDSVFLDAKTGENLLDRIFDRAYCFDFRGPSYRGKNRKTMQVDFSASPKLPLVR